jgi:tripeptide aminopeptidase
MSLRRFALGAALASIGTLAIVMRAACAQEMSSVAEPPAQISPAIDKAFTALMAAPTIVKLLDSVKADHDRTVADMRMLTEIEAPPFQEQKKAEAFLVRMKEVGIVDAAIDAEGNVVGRRKGSGNGPTLLISAHLDTVFPAGTDVKIKEHDGKFFAPGVSDDTRGLAVLLEWVKALNDNHIQTVGDLLIAGNVGEEGLGNLRGMRRIFADHRDIDGMVGLEPVGEGRVIVLGVASHRFEVEFKAPGGHSYRAFGQVPSAIHGMGRAIAKIAEIQTPKSPKTTFTVGTVSGGTSVNTIAPDARMAIDIRSESMEALLATEKTVMVAIDEAVAEENRRWNVRDLTGSAKIIGDRPGGRTSADSAIVQAATRSNAAFGVKTLLTSASTDANVPMGFGIPAIIVSGGGKTGGFHALSEWIDVTDGWKGAQNSLVIVLGLVGVEGVSEPLLEKRPPRAD